MPVTLKGATILVVDDEPDFREILNDWILREGCQVIQAENGRSALDHLKNHPVDVVVSDVRMPEMDGVSLANELKKGGVSARSILFLTGYADLTPQQAYDMGIEAMLSKPIDRKTLIGQLKRMMTPREERWSEAMAQEPSTLIRQEFESLHGAMQQKLLCFGRGGFCIKSDMTAKNGPVGFDLRFTEERSSLRGQGYLRWAEHKRQLLGVEFYYLEPECRPLTLNLTDAGKFAFIPKDCE